MVRCFVLVFAISLAFEGHARADLIFGNPLTGSNLSGNPFTSGQTVNFNVTATGIGRGSGITENATNNRYNATSWDTPAIDTNAYFTFGITPTAGAVITFDDFVYTGQASGTGPTAFAFRSNLDGFSSDIGTPTAAGATISLAAPQFQSVSSAIEFRLYGWNASGGVGTFSVNDFSFNGSVTAVPEPSSILLLGLAGASVGVGRRWRQKRLAV